MNSWNVYPSYGSLQKTLDLSQPSHFRTSKHQILQNYRRISRDQLHYFGQISLTEPQTSRLLLLCFSRIFASELWTDREGPTENPLYLSIYRISMKHFGWGEIQRRSSNEECVPHCHSLGPLCPFTVDNIDRYNCKRISINKNVRTYSTPRRAIGEQSTRWKLRSTGLSLL